MRFQRIDYIKVISRYKLTLILIPLVCILIYLGIAKFIVKPTYQSQVIFQVGKNEQQSLQYQQYTHSFTAVLRDQEHAAALENLVPGFAGAQTVVVNRLPDKGFLQLTVEGTSPQQSAAAANGEFELLRQYIAVFKAPADVVLIQGAKLPVKPYSPKILSNTLLTGEVSFTLSLALVSMLELDRLNRQRRLRKTKSRA